MGLVYQRPLKKKKEETSLLKNAHIRPNKQNKCTAMESHLYFFYIDKGDCMRTSGLYLVGSVALHCFCMQRENGSVEPIDHVGRTGKVVVVLSSDSIRG